MDSPDDASFVGAPSRARVSPALTMLSPATGPRHPLRALLNAVVERAAGEMHGGRPLDERRQGLAALFLRALRVADIPCDASDRQARDGEYSLEEVSVVQRALIWEASRSKESFDARDLARVLASFDSMTNRPVRADDASRTFGERLGSVDAVQAVVEIAHDMQSPLGSILFLVDTLRRGQSGPVTPVQERQLGLIYGATLGLSNLSCDVLDALRGGQRLVDGMPIPFSIANVILDVCDTVRPISEEKELELTYTLPVGDGRLGYPSALERVLINLVTNALKYTREGSVRIGCTERSLREVEFWVEDTGEGIPPHVMTMLFDGFRPGATGVRFSNAGLGLAICQNFLRDLGSRLQVESSPATGTRFSFVLELPPA